MANFMATDAEDQPLYAQIPDYDVLRATLDVKLAEYNDSNPKMELVLFQQVSRLRLLCLHLTQQS